MGVERGDALGAGQPGGVQGDLDLGETARAAWPRRRPAAQRGRRRDRVTRATSTSAGSTRSGRREHDEVALRRAGHDGRALDRVRLALEVDVVQPVAVEVAAGRHVADDGVVLPRVPQPAHDVDAVGRLAAQRRRVGERRSAPRRAAVGAGAAGDDPPGPAVADVVERGERDETWNGSV